MGDLLATWAALAGVFAPIIGVGIVLVFLGDLAGWE